ncbi:MAG TPA: Smr/MutS family protein [Novosphingobium sp.]|nr:Smr/MutS family protein [Novosphingobium sp.]
MRRPGRKLSREEAEVWAKVTQTVKPLVKRKPVPPAAVDANQSRTKSDDGRGAPAAVPAPAKKIEGRVPPPLPAKAAPRKIEAQPHLDGSWEKRISKGTLVPDFSLDLHGSNLETAYGRLMHGLTQAKAMGARVVLVVTGKPRPADPMDRGEKRGAIRSKIADWLTASEHASDIVAIRGAHRRHGGPGAIYIMLKKRR